MTMELWSTNGHPYMGTRYPDHFVIYARTRDSGTLNESNWICIIKDLDENKINYQIVRFSHWLCGWIDTALIHKDDPGVPFCHAISDRLKQYPVYNEDHFSSLEWEKAGDMADEILRDITDIKEDPDSVISGDVPGWSHITFNMTRDQIIDTILDYGMID